MWCPTSGSWISVHASRPVATSQQTSAARVRIVRAVMGETEGCDRSVGGGGLGSMTPGIFSTGNPELPARIRLGVGEEGGWRFCFPCWFSVVSQH